MGSRTAATVLFIAIALLSGNTYAGIFGSSNYEECVVDKMKGQPANMVGLVANACRKQFPAEEMLVEGQNFKKGQLVDKWSVTAADTISVTVDRNDTAYKLTRVDGRFWKLVCDKQVGNPEPDIEVSAEAPLFGSTFKFQIDNAVQYKCGSISIFGKKK